ncbi:hypothetical protein [Amorphus orientalis]|uniref:Uncharacterized protein n=1 Tax=Amorphus orientalis TaxID=649198 RepID=A0AAE3VT56_9HYPH|nr:hypothetical protein [Amorphus orientalis]MDQ0317720.1 hypothetical protein [Amorphus orientalis]
MSRFRAHMDRGRRTLHEHMSVPALYFDAALTHVQAVTVRVHENYVRVGGQSNFHAAEVEEDSPRISFLLSEVEQPQRGFYVTTGPGVGYVVDHKLPSGSVDVMAEVTRQRPVDIAGLPTPYGDGWLPAFIRGSLTFPAMRGG